MAPHSKPANENLPTETAAIEHSTHLKLPAEIGTDYNFKREIVWFNAIGFVFLHIAALIGYCLCFYAHSFTVTWSKKNF